MTLHYNPIGLIYPSLTTMGEITYWQERLDSFLKLTDYTSLSMPAQDFGVKVAENSDYRKQWMKFVGDYKETNIKWKTPVPSPSNEVRISEELDALLGELNHPK